MLTLVEQARLLHHVERASRALSDHAIACRRCQRAERRCAHPMAYCRVGRAWLRAWRLASRRLRAG